MEPNLKRSDANTDALYSLVVSAESSTSTHEVYICVFLRNTILKNLKFGPHRHLNVRGQQLCTKSFRYDFTATSDAYLKLIVPEKNPYIVAVEPEDGMIKASDIWRESQHEDLQHRLLNYHIKITMKGREFDPPLIKFKGSTDDSQLEIQMSFDYRGKLMMLRDTDRSGRQEDPPLELPTAKFVPNEDIQFGYHSASGRSINITSDGLGAKKMRGLGNGITYGAKPLKGVAEFEVKIEVRSSLSGLQFGIMRCKKDVPIKSGPSIPSVSFAVANHCIWADQRLSNNIITPSKQSDYGYIDLDDLREGDCVGLRLSKDGVLEFAVNDESQGIAAKNVYAWNSDVYAVVDHYGASAATIITKAVICDDINLQELCLKKLACWLKNGDEVALLPIPSRLQDEIKCYFDE